MKDYCTEIKTENQKAAFIAQGLDLVYDSASKDFNSSEWFIVFDDEVYVVNFNYKEEYVFWSWADAMECYNEFITEVIEQSARHNMKDDVTISFMICNLFFKEIFDGEKVKNPHYLSELFNSNVIKSRTLDKKFELKREDKVK